MKRYQDVVAERYGTSEKTQHIYDNQYAIINPIGFYGRTRAQNVFYLIFNHLRKMGYDLTTAKILDVGCGSGAWTRFFAEFTGSPSNIAGLDLSSDRLERAKEMNPAIMYYQADIVHLPIFDMKWTIITAIDIFMHLNTEEQILDALKGIREALDSNGIFVWYDVVAKDHFNVPDDADSAGFSPEQMEAFAKTAGFEKVYSVSLFKKILGKVHSLYLYRRYSPRTVSFVEKTLPGKAGNIAIVFKKA